jgi:Icc-related predicted phosphoesterase
MHETEHSMRIYYMSDLHLEFDVDSLYFYNTLRVRGRHQYSHDVLVLAGDISVKTDVEFIKLSSNKFKYVVVVFGNHEYYHGRIDKVEQITRASLSDCKNVHILQNESVTLDGVSFHGTTLWTDMNKGNPTTQNIVNGGINDFRLIKYKNLAGAFYKFGAKDAIKEHMIAKQFLADNIKKGDVVVTHMAPTYLSIHEKYKNDMHLNGAYASDLSELILDTQPAVWFHGHVHNSFDYQVGDTRVLCNPRGYSNSADQNLIFNPELYWQTEIIE